MLETLKGLILDYQEDELQTGVARHLKIETLSGKATVIIGVRRAGKSTYLYQIMQRLLQEGVPKENILYLNFFDDRLHNLQYESLGIITEAYFSLYPEKKGKEVVYCFFDEIQILAGWESYIDRLMRTEKCQVYLSGSSAQMLSQEIATQMRGRALAWEIFPFSFKEFLDYKSINRIEPFSTKKRLLIQKAFEVYWECGGFPETMDLSISIRIKIHQDYLQSILFRDLVERHNISHPRAVIDLTHRLIDNIGSLYTVNSLTGFLKSLGHKAPKSEVSNYLAWLEDSYFLFTVRLYDASLQRSKKNPKKIYCIDHAFVRSAAPGTLVNSGHLLENLVFTALRRLYPEIYYYKTKNRREVDFVIPLRHNKKLLIQVCEKLIDAQTKKREITALGEAMKELGIDRGIIVTRNDEELLQTANGEIRIVPVWRFLIKELRNLYD